MKVDVLCKWSDDDMKTYENLVGRDFTIGIDTDYIRNEDDLITMIADGIYNEYGIIKYSSSAVKNTATNYYEILNEILDGKGE